MAITITEWGPGMNGKILALLLITAALGGATGAAQARDGNTFTAPTIVNVGSGSALKFAASAAASLANRILTVFSPHMAERSCLASAVYFEARSEPLQGQLAVAVVVLNRVKALHYPSTICGVVYQGASHLNACQFSFACDGEPDFPTEHRAWDAALVVTALALAGDNQMLGEETQFVASATNYHADYVKPGWSRSLRRLTKIGRHIFYARS